MQGKSFSINPGFLHNTSSSLMIKLLLNSDKEKIEKGGEMKFLLLFGTRLKPEEGLSSVCLRAVYVCVCFVLLLGRISHSLHLRGRDWCWR